MMVKASKPQKMHLATTQGSDGELIGFNLFILSHFEDFLQGKVVEAMNITFQFKSLISIFRVLKIRVWAGPPQCHASLVNVSV